MANRLRPKGMWEAVNADDWPWVKSVAQQWTTGSRPKKQFCSRHQDCQVMKLGANARSMFHATGNLSKTG
ncbi:hypothetical protein [Ralstonia pseudosolanacearum]|uniref:hypothetical protein n=1 Tax=Ralstonia pseudosolanacearum TaxID=1310165 RepID=UPI003CF22771